MDYSRLDKAIELMKVERACIKRNEENCCDRNCKICDLVQSTDELLGAYDFVIRILEHCKQMEEK